MPPLRQRPGSPSGRAITTVYLAIGRFTSGVGGVGPVFPGCVRLAQAMYPGVPIVGHQLDDRLAAAHQAGFERVHGLSVWQRASIAAVPQTP
jgi:hypothetical protein